MYTRVGTEQYEMGNYSGAASSFEQALKNGGEPIQWNFRLGQAYQHQGHTSEALAAYQHAIDASNAALSSGRGNAARIRAIKDACEQAVTVLHGG
jgi:tetratricopeptide (TPR) repeat protein